MLRSDFAKTIVCILRHAERPPIPPGTFGNELEITPAGRLAAEQFGAKIRREHRITRILSSPVLRCVQTAEAIQQAARVETQVVPHRYLGEPSVFIEDISLAGLHFLEAGPRKIVRRLLHGERFAGMREPKAGTDLLLKELLAERSSGLTVCVTHDAILACVQNVLTGIRYEDEHWPAFLENIWLEVKPGELEVTWRGQRFQYSFPN